MEIAACHSGRAAPFLSMCGGVSKGDELLRAWQRYWLVKLVRPEHQTGFWSLSFVVTKLLILRIGPEGLRAPVSIDAVLEALCELDGGPRNPPGGKPQRRFSTARTLAA